MASTLNLIGWFGVFAALFTYVLLPFFTETETLIRFFLITGLTILMSVLLLILIRIDYVNTASYLFICFAFLTFSIDTILFGSGLTDISYMTLLAIAPILAGFMFGFRASVLLLAMCALVGAYLAWQEQIGNLPIGSEYTPFMRLVASIITFSYVPLIIRLWQNYQDTYIEGERARIEEKIKNETLEELVAKRTAQLGEALQEAETLSWQLSGQLDREHQINEMRSTIINNVSHAFRTPMTIINNSAEIIGRYKNPQYNKEIDQLVTRIKDQIFYIDEQLQDVLLVSKINADEYTTTSWETIEFNEACDLMIRFWVSEFDLDNEIRFTYDQQNNQTIEILLDPITQIVTRLISNSLKFSANPPQIEVTIGFNKKDFIIEVNDQGNGLPSEPLEKLFEAFYKGENGINKRGLGLGLYIADQIASKIEGELIHIPKQNESGTHFQLNVPFRLARKTD
ncbi:MAG: ATP-binding protein [Chloroflexota bacterium]